MIQTTTSIQSAAALIQETNNCSGEGCESEIIPDIGIGQIAEDIFALARRAIRKTFDKSSAIMTRLTFEGSFVRYEIDRQRKYDVAAPIEAFV
jgi:hypothetical protein